MAAGDTTDYGGSWYEPSMVTPLPRGKLTVDLDVDVCVVGAGLAGLTAAREIVRRGWSVVVLEARRVAWNASGRNTGFVLPGFGADPETIIERVGLEQARSLWALSEAGFEYVRANSRDMPGAEYAEGGWLNVSKTDEEADTAKHADLLAREFGAAVEFWPATRVRDVLQSPLYFGAIQYPKAFTIHPLNYALGLAAAAEAAGARIFEETPAIEIDPDGVRKRIVTPTARVRATHVVLAGNVHIGRVMPSIARTLLPISTYIITTAPLGELLREIISYPGAVSDTELADNHYRVVGGDRLMWSGRSTTWRGDPRRYMRPLLADIRRAYPQLGDVEVEYAWTGMLGNTVHRMPQIGEVSPGFWLLSGFGGHGLNTTAMGGELIARAIVEDDRTWRQFMPFELVWAGGLLGRAAMQAYYWGYRSRERIKGRIARERRRKAELVSQRGVADMAGAAPRAGKS
jgi:gamma-glutamylputrescine oxidase